MMGDAPAGGAGISVPVFLHDGENQISIGNAVVHPSMKFHELQSAVSLRLGLTPDQISIYLAEKRLYRSWPRKVPVNNKFNFATITGSKDVYFLVFLKRSKAGRGEKAQNFPKQRPPENVVLLQREAGIAGQMYGRGYGVPAVDPYEYDRRLMELAMEREVYRMMTNEMNNGRGHSPPTPRIVKGPDVFCEECEKAKAAGPGRAAEFHCCPNDPVLTGPPFFRSLAGPISRPGKN